MKKPTLALLLVASLWAAPAGAVVALYEVFFEATWSPATHPVDFPPSPHFSGLVGGTHDDFTGFWQEGGLASSGIEAMAENGVQSTLSNEVTAGGGDFLLLGGGIPFSPGSRTLQFTVDQLAPRVTLVSMLAPSPDWFVGVNGLPLWDRGWRPEVVVDLFPYDAGTDSGPTFLAPDADTQPPDPISELSGFPFADTGPVGSFTFSLIAGCSDGIDNDEDGRVDFDGGGVGEPDPQCSGDPDRLLEHRQRSCGLLGIEPLLMLGPFLAFRRRRSALSLSAARRGQLGR